MVNSGKKMYESKTTYKDIQKFCLYIFEGKCIKGVKKNLFTRQHTGNKLRAGVFQQVLKTISLSKPSRVYLKKQGTYANFTKIDAENFLKRKMNHPLNTFMIHLFCSTEAIYSGKMKKVRLLDFISDQEKMGITQEHLKKAVQCPVSEEEYRMEWQFIDMLFGITSFLYEQKRRYSHGEESSLLVKEYLIEVEKRITVFYREQSIVLLNVDSEQDENDACIMESIFHDVTFEQSESFNLLVNDFENLPLYSISRLLHIIIKWWLPFLNDYLKEKLIKSIDEKNVKMIQKIKDDNWSLEQVVEFITNIDFDTSRTLIMHDEYISEENLVLPFLYDDESLENADLINKCILNPKYELKD